MAKLISLAELFGILNTAPVPSSPDHFLFLLGTDTKFTPRPTMFPIRDYERGETLSYVAQAMALLLNEEGASNLLEPTPIANALSYDSPSVDVLNGPTTRGTEVGNRIAQGVFLALRAAASGKKTLQISGHSRGAVETILVMHELDRIKKELAAAPDKKLRDILIQSKSSSGVGAAMLLLFPQDDETDTKANRAQLLQNLNELKINSFLIDPVPGDTVYALPGISWHDPLFYEKPPCDSYELLLCRDERSGCFYPIVPKDMQPTIIPGHHGTACGNRYTQQVKDLPDNLSHLDTTGVQDLVVVKLLHFINHATHAFDAPVLDRPNLELEHPQLDILLNAYRLSDAQQRSQLLLAKYVKVQENDAAYRHFTTTTYDNLVLGKALTSDGQRYIHYQAQGFTSMAILSPEMQGGFVNTEHAITFLDEHIDFSLAANQDTDIQVLIITEAIQKILAEIEQDATDPTKLSSLLPVFETLAGKERFFNGLSIVIDSISQKYLRNHLTADEKKKLIDVIQLPFAALQKRKTLDGVVAVKHLELIEECEKVLQEGVKKTVEMHYDTIIQQSKEMDQQIQLFLAPEKEFKDAFELFLSVLSGHPLAEMREITPVSIASVQQKLTELLETPSDISQSNSATSVSVQIHMASLMCPEFRPLEAHLEANNYNTEHYLSKIEWLFDATTSLHQAYPELNPLVGEKKLTIDPQQLRFHRQNLILLAARILKEKNYNLRLAPTGISESFYQLIKQEAIVLGAPDPAVEDLNALNELLKSEKEQACGTIIHQKLKPLTTDYMAHLLTQAKKYYPEVTVNEEAKLPDAVINNPSAQKAYNDIKNKFNNVQGLYQQLTANQVALPSKRIENFSQALHTCEADLKLHRDPFWKAYFKSCLAVLAIVATGIIPGLICLAAYSTLTGKSPLFFSQSVGATFVEKANRCAAEVEGPAVRG